MKAEREEELVFEIGLVIPKRSEKDVGDSDAVRVLIEGFRKVGLVVDKVTGLSDEFIKLAAPLEALGRAAANLHIKKRTRIGMDLPFEWDQVKAFATQSDGSMFSWCERYRCYHYLIYGIVNESKSARALMFDGKKFFWESWDSLLQTMESPGIVKQVFPLHDERKRKHLLKSWAFNWWDLTKQPIDDIYLYFGTKIAMYFAFLGMYTRWLLFPAALGIIIQFVNFGAWQYMVLPFFFISIISWAVVFLQFWKRKNFALLTRWQISYITGTGPGFKVLGEWNPLHSPELAKKLDADKMGAGDKEVYQRVEWFGHLLRIRNDAIIILSIICLQLPFELAYAHLYESVESNLVKFGLTAAYLVIIQYFTRIGGKISVGLIKDENYENTENRADSLVYKIFENLLENSVPYLKYSFKKFRAVRNKKHQKGLSKDKIQLALRVEKESMKPAYSASIGEDLEDGLFDDFLELALQFGMVMMFACAFPPAFAFAAVNNVMEIRTDALKLLVILKRPVPRAAATIGAWLNIFQFLIVLSICTNCALLVCLYDAEGKWKIEPGLAAILIFEHILLLIKFGFSRFVPEEPAWVRANRLKHTNQAQDVSMQLLRSISDREQTDQKKSE